jgi:triosephosphate isomerase (TIM)
MSRRPLMAGNWKMHKSIAEAVDLAQKLKAAPPAADRDTLVCPPFTALASVAKVLAGSGIAVGAQNMNDNVQGAFTGEVSPAMIKDAGAGFVILGHSERRSLYGETDAFINKKAKLALEQGLTPIVCVGETLAEREAGRTLAVVETQVRGSLAGLSAAQLEASVVAYEPVWAIGTGKTASPEQAQEVHAMIRSLLEKLQGAGAAAKVRILYGGSVKPDNVDALMSQPDIDGGLVGGASLKAEDFLRLMNFKKAARV